MCLSVRGAGHSVAATLQHCPGYLSRSYFVLSTSRCLPWNRSTDETVCGPLFHVLSMLAGFTRVIAPCKSFICSFFQFLQVPFSKIWLSMLLFRTVFCTRLPAGEQRPCMHLDAPLLCHVSSPETAHEDESSYTSNMRSAQEEISKRTGLLPGPHPSP